MFLEEHDLHEVSIDFQIREKTFAQNVTHSFLANPTHDNKLLYEQLVELENEVILGTFLLQISTELNWRQV